MPLFRHAQGTGTGFLIPGRFAGEGLLPSSSSPEPRQVSSRTHFGSRLMRLKPNDISTASDGLYVGDSAAAGYYGNGDLRCKARSKAKAVEIQLPFLQEKGGQGWERVLWGITFAFGQNSYKRAKNWPRKDLRREMGHPVKPWWENKIRDLS